MGRIKQILNAVVIWINPQHGVIDALKRGNYAMSELALTLRASRQSERNENDKLRQWQHRTESERDEARYEVAALTAEVERLTAEGSKLAQMLVDQEAETSRAYNRLGELARLADPVCEWVLANMNQHDDPVIYIPASELMDYVEAVRP